MKRAVLRNLLIVAAAMVSVNSCMFLQQSSMIFFPYAGIDQVPGDWGLAYEEVFLQTADGVRLHGWYLPHAESKRALLFFHGNAGNISHRRASLEIFHRLGLNVLIFDYRGYGRSEGVPDEQGLYEDARAAWRYLIDERGFEPRQIILFGRSLGGAVAAWLAAQVHPGALILESSFSSVRDMANALFPVLSRLVVLRYRFDTVAYVRRVTCPVLVLHSPEDEIIPFHLGEKVFRAANAPKRFVRMRGDHNSGFLMSQPEYERAIAAFLHLDSAIGRSEQGRRREDD